MNGFWARIPGTVLVLAIYVASAAAAEPMDVERCVAVALTTSASVQEKEARVAQWQARLREVESVFYPKLQAIGLVAPMFTIRFDDIAERSSPTRWKDIRHWGPSLNFSATLMQPVFTFGRASAGELAASERIEVERARLREARNAVALEVRKLFYMHLYTKSILPSLNYAAGILADAKEEADKLFAAGGGEVTQVDLMKLRLGDTKVRKFRIQAERGAELSLAALKHTMGWPADRELVLAERRLPRRLPPEDPDLARLMAEASQNRPEWAQVEHGQRAALALANAEFLANMPVLALAGTLRAAWTPTVDDTLNFYHQDPFNDFFGGVALVLRFDLDPWAANAREEHAEALHDELEALHRFAATGIPLQVKKAFGELEKTRELVAITKDATQATKSWVTSAVVAFASGTGSPRDMLEGLAAYVEAKNAEYEAVRDFFLARAELDFAVGRARRP